jgi:Sulfatase
MMFTRGLWLGLLALVASVIMGSMPASAQQPKPNILVIMGDDIGYWNISAYNRGMMGYHTPNIDRIADEGAIFTDCLRIAERDTPQVLRIVSGISSGAALTAL